MSLKLKFRKNMRYIILLIININFYIGVSGQSLTKSSKGSSSILLLGNTINFDISDAELGIAGSNLLNSQKKTNSFIIGGSLSAKNETGIGNIFSDGNLTPSGKISGFLGYSYFPRIKSTQKFRSKRKEKVKERTELASTFQVNLKKLLTTKFSNQQLNKKLDKLKKSKVPDIEKYLENLKDTFPNEQKEIEKIKKELSDKYKIYVETDNKLETEIRSFGEKISKINYSQFVIYFFGEGRATDFKRFTAFDQINLQNSFVDENYRGGKFGLGINYLWKNWTFGITYGYFYTHNLSLLSKKEYTLRTTNTLNNQTIIEEKKITGYSGAYGTVDIQELNLDIVYSIKLDKKAKNVLLINPYLYAQLSTDNPILLPNVVNTGLGLYFSTGGGKFLGGLYLELPDLDNKLEKAKPIEEQNFRSPLQRFTFGIITKIPFGAIKLTENGKKF